MNNTTFIFIPSFNAEVALLPISIVQSYYIPLLTPPYLLFSVYDPPLCSLHD